ncbi:hypothetical protein PVL29_026881 [Vitis rotundifolia]|uniref:Protein kinase domain-containing protein n=1 Tax=Vitis rotundifolia TaxID=103349 RepID=A0AA39D4N6_VITRO|nr:hypothetical protein PVL29_026881 [Vitis rotundifolia]
MLINFASAGKSRQWLMMSMDKLHHHKVILTLLLLIHSSDYALTDKYLINSGSISDTAISTQYFVGDVDSCSSNFSVGESSRVVDDNPAPGTPFLYRTARIFRKQSSYGFQITQNGTYVVRFHFYPFSTPTNLADALFNVSANGFSLLSNFSVQNTSNPPVIKEFAIPIEVGIFMIYFTPQKSFFAFVNAIEAFLAPEDFISDGVSHVTPAGLKGTYNGLLSQAFHIIHRINVGGFTITPSNDLLWRSWTPDDGYLFLPNSANNIAFYGELNSLGAAANSAPDNVYKTAKELNINHSRSSIFFNMTWGFDVNKNSTYFVRVHFCDIISQDVDDIVFNLSIYNQFIDKIDPYNITYHPATPFHGDYVVDSDDSGYVNISAGPRSKSLNQTAFLNGLEIMEMIKRSGAYPVPSNPNKTLQSAPCKPRKTPEPNKTVEPAPAPSKPNTLTSKPKKNIFAIASSVVGVAFVLILIGVFMKCRKANSVETRECSVLLYGGRPFCRTNDRTADTSVCSLSLGLKLPFSEILHATNNFNPKVIIGEGGFGKVYRGTLRDGKKVAVKRRQPGQGQGLYEFQTEIIVLSKIRHRHLVSLIGYCDERHEMILVYEFMENGTLQDLLYDSSEDCSTSSPRSELSWEQRLEICIASAMGLDYLHRGARIIHRDVKSTNILLDENYVAKVADFGLSKSGDGDQTHISTDVKGSFGYLDPEYFRCMQLTYKSDVYSFGVVLLEVLCSRPAIKRSVPREEMNLAEWAISWQKKGQLEKIVDPFLVGKINPNSLRKFGETAEKCLRDSGADRPTMREVERDLRNALDLQQARIPRE